MGTYPISDHCLERMLKFLRKTITLKNIDDSNEKHEMLATKTPRRNATRTEKDKKCEIFNAMHNTEISKPIAHFMNAFQLNGVQCYILQ